MKKRLIIVNVDEECHFFVSLHRQISVMRSAICDFLLVFYSNCGPMMYRFRDKKRYLQKKFPPPLYFMPPPRWFLSEFFLTAAGLQKLKWCSYQNVKNVWRYVHSFLTHWCDRRTEFQSMLTSLKYTHTHTHTHTQWLSHLTLLSWWSDWPFWSSRPCISCSSFYSL